MIDLPPGKFSCIVADPPWTFKTYSANGLKKSAQAHYSCMTAYDIMELPVTSVAADDCFLFLWTSAPMLDTAFAVMRSWGFAYKSRMAWRKMTVNGKVRVGPGYIVRTMHEDVLIGTRGKPKLSSALPSIFDGLAREHSRKPDEFFTLLDRRAPGPHLELFARQSRFGWTTWGDQAEKFDIPPTVAAWSALRPAHGMDA
jgi:N6-adenosine-specific RNA methylase IME4